MKRRETMHAVQAPDVYAGDGCDEHEAQWSGCAAGDKDGEGVIGKTISLNADTFPPGTRISISEPVCPICEAVPSRSRVSDNWSCECDFNWRDFAADHFS